MDYLLGKVKLIEHDLLRSGLWHLHCLLEFGILQEELGTEYLVQPLGRAEDEEHSSDFEPEENGDGAEDEEIDEEDDADDAEDSVKAQSSTKRKRSGDDGDDGDDDGDDDDDGRPPSKR